MDKEYWDKISGTYDVEIFDVLKNDQNKIITSFIKQVASPQKTIADIGCGIGKWLPLLSSQFGHVTAIDLSDANLRYARKRYQHLKNVSYQNGDMAAGPEGSSGFDAVLCVNAVITDSYSKREAFFGNLSLGLGKGGYLVLVVPSLESALYAGYMLDRCNRKAGIVPERISGTVEKSVFEHFKYGVIRIDNIPTKHYLEEELIDTLREFDFEIQQIKKVEYEWDTEIEEPPKWLKDPYPWDWAVLAKKK
jgi:ubiquinone/menaquinone biosynthesis C-methylase UbiE